MRKTLVQRLSDAGRLFRDFVATLNETHKFHYTPLAGLVSKCKTHIEESISVIEWIQRNFNRIGNGMFSSYASTAIAS